MNKILFLLFIFNIFYIVPSYSDTYVDGYVVCATDANGAILVNEEGSSDLSSFAYASDPTNFDLITRGEVGGSMTDIGASCDITPDNYKLKFFKLGFCSEDPTREPVNSASNTVVADLSSWIDIFDNPDGKEVNIKPGEEVNLLEGEIVLPLGSYQYQYTIIDNIINIKHTQTYVAASGAADFDILGYNPTQNDKGDANFKGKTCWTAKDNSGVTMMHTQSFELAESGGTTTIRGFNLPTDYTGSQPLAKFRCASAVGTGNAKIDWFVSIVNSFGTKMCDVNTSCTRDESKFRNGMTRTRGFNTNFPNVAQAYYLLKSDNTIATDPDDVTKLLWVQDNLDNIINITENTVGLRLNFKTNNALSMGIHQDCSASCSRSTELMAVQIWSGTIFGNVQTKTRRARGAWR